MKILRIGSYHGAPFRYINLFKNSEFEYSWIYLDGDNQVENLIKLAKHNDVNNVDFIKVKNVKLIQFIQKVSLKLAGHISRIIYPIYIVGFRILFSSYKFPDEVYTLVENADFTWIGNNDLDHCLVLTSLFKYKFPDQIIRLSYQEHRSIYRLDEKMALEYADKLIIPTMGSVKILKEIYNKDFINKTVIANEDWRSESLHIIEPSKKNEKPRILIISNFAEYGKPSARRGSRVNYLSVINQLLEMNCEIHLYANKICYSYGFPDMDTNTPYHEMNDNEENFTLVKGPLPLNTLDDYEQFKDFDYGLLHNFEKNEVINNFNKINIPNRTFEYICMGIKPILIKNTLIEVEKLIYGFNFGIVLESYSQLIDRHKEEDELVKVHNTYYTFENFIRIILNE